MAGIYIHVPFCKQACHYCNFHFSTSLGQKNALLSALYEEIAARKAYLGDATINTVYLGGGTPSMLSKSDLTTLFNALYQHFNIADDAEVTLEANPDDLTEEKVAYLAKSPVNRLSIGIQSFVERDLQYMQRAHNAEEARRSVEMAKKAGITNITIDLIYGTPGMDHADWKYNLQTAFDLDVPHLSAYCLTVEPNTALAHEVEKGKAPDVDEVQAQQQFDILRQMATEAGFDHYEISNFAKPGFKSKHNSGYWKGIPYIGLGPAAHSFNGTDRQWNIANNNKYIKALAHGEPYFEVEQLTPADRLNEYLMTGLRTSMGVNLDHVQKKFGNELMDHVLTEASHHLADGTLRLDNTTLHLPAEHRFLADSIISDLFVV